MFVKETSRRGIFSATATAATATAVFVSAAVAVEALGSLCSGRSGTCAVSQCEAVRDALATYARDFSRYLAAVPPHRMSLSTKRQPLSKPCPFRQKFDRSGRRGSGKKRKEGKGKEEGKFGEKEGMITEGRTGSTMCSLEVFSTKCLTCESYILLPLQ